MSTRCNIIVKGTKSTNHASSITLYHHHDGYPGGVGSILKEYVNYLSKNNCRCDWAMIANRLVRKGLTFVNSEGQTDCDDEYEITSGLHGDSEYLYVIEAIPYGEDEDDKPVYTLSGYKVEFRYDRDLERDMLVSKEPVEIPDLNNEDWHITLK